MNLAERTYTVGLILGTILGGIVGWGFTQDAMKCDADMHLKIITTSQGQNLYSVKGEDYAYDYLDANELILMLEEEEGS